MAASNSLLSAYVHAMRMEASGVLGLELRPWPGTLFPPAGPGAHIDLHLPGGLVRSYSLLPSAPGRYALAVLRDRGSRGGSRYVHERLRVGERLSLSPPRDHFRLEEGARHSVLIAGGIGITPLFGMYRRLRELQRPVQLLYCARSERDMAFREELPEQPGQVRWHLDEVHGGPPDLRAFMAACPADADYYCCGPAPMIAAFEHQAGALGRCRTHVERFAARADPAAESAVDGPAFEIELARSGRCLQMPAGTSILDVLLEAGVEVDYNCQEGICGACETRVLAGRPEHRDGVLSQAEREAGRTMMICVSGCLDGRLVLDL